MFSLVGLVVLFLLFAFVPPLREGLKKILNALFMFFAGGFFIIYLIASFYLYPKLVSLYEALEKPLNTQASIMSLGLGFLLSLLLFFIGWKFKHLTKSNSGFYLMFALLVLIIGVLGQVLVVSIISPIYTVTSSFQR